MATQTTPLSPAAWRPDITAYVPDDVIPDALILTTATVVGRIEGDEPAVRVPYVSDDGTVGFIAEGQPIPDAAQEFDEVVVQTNKVAALGKYSYETLAQPEAARMVTNSLRRSVVRKANAAYLGNASGPTGLLNIAGLTDAGIIDENLDPVVDAIAGIEAAGGMATNIIAAPDAWATLSKLKVTDTSAQPLIGPDVTQPGQRALLGVPVSVTPSMPEGELIVVDRASVIAAVSQVRLARSEDAFFANDVVAIRLTFRLGWDVMHTDRVAKL
ncbi:phage major capsid protein, partial [Mycolicibacterium sp. CR10]|uniref:phage major capsid protein n=1 Tax=Mycolicibacterium sp. CR10 TaxID=2562314 RepID=UPI001485431F